MNVLRRCMVLFTADETWQEKQRFFFKKKNDEKKKMKDFFWWYESISWEKLKKLILASWAASKLRGKDVLDEIDRPANSVLWDTGSRS